MHVHLRRRVSISRDNTLADMSSRQLPTCGRAPRPPNVECMSDVRSFPDAQSVHDWSRFCVSIGGRQVTLAEFLAECAASLADSGQDVGAGFAEARGALLDGGLPVLRALTDRTTAWIQTGLAFSRDAHKELCGRLAVFARELLARPDVHNFFFMGKPPGMRFRVEVAVQVREEVAAELDLRFARWLADGVLDRATPGVYEPEAHLFGGPVSMESVHRLFTADSLAWLGRHALVDPCPDWALSLVMLRSLLEQLGVVGWEDRDVWDLVRRRTYRRLPERHLAEEAFPAVADGLRRAWGRPQALREALPPRLQELLGEYEATVAEAAPRWMKDYFATRDAYVGPREAAAFYTIFHWNRAGLPMPRQALIAESLARAGFES